MPTPLTPAVRLLAEFAFTVVLIVAGCTVVASLGGPHALMVGRAAGSRTISAGPADSGSARGTASQTVATRPTGAFPQRLPDHRSRALVAYRLPAGHAGCADEAQAKCQRLYLPWHRAGGRAGVVRGAPPSGRLARAASDRAGAAAGAERA